MVAETRIRLYESALNGVRYVYGAPVRYSRDPKLLKQRADDLAAAVDREQSRADAAEMRKAA